METNITLQDMAIMINVIDVCSERGAFKGAELATVGQLREKIAVFVKKNQPEQPSNAEETDTELDEGAE